MNGLDSFAYFILFWSALAGLSALEHFFGDRNYARRLRRWPANLSLGIVNGAIFALAPFNAAVTADWSRRHDFGLFSLTDLPWGLAAAATVLLISLAQWTIHWLAHKWPVLWAFHRVHHCDAHLDGTTTLRFHPVDYAANFTFQIPVIIVFGLDAATLAVFGLVELAANFLAHTNLRLPPRLETRLRRWVITPGLHHIHHSDDVRETDTNYGAVLTLWDRVFRTYQPEPVRPAEAFRLGLGDVSQEVSEDAGALVLLPFARRAAGANPLPGAGGQDGRSQ